MIGGVIKFVKRGAAPVATITLDDMAAHEWGQDVPDQVPFVRQQELELPLSVSIVYPNQATDYQQGLQLAQRQVGNSISAVSVEVAIVMTDAKAKEVADVNLYAAWEERVVVSGVMLSTKWSRLEPTDIVTLIKGTRAYRVRLVQKDDGVPGVIKFDGVVEGVNTYLQYGAPAGSAGFVEQTVLVLADTLLVLLDLPLLRDVDDTPGYYAVACANDAGDWPGCGILKSIDNGASYSTLVTDTHAATIGHTIDALGDWDGTNLVDEKSSVQVVLKHGTLSNSTLVALVNGANAAVIGDEIVQFKNAELIAANTYRLTGLLRGRRGTMWATAGHTDDEAFVLVNTATWLRIDATLAEVNLPRAYKGVTIGGVIADTTVQWFTNTARALKPFAPAHLGGHRDASGNLTVTWMRCDRKFGVPWKDKPLSEESEAYEIEVLDGSTVVRTLTSTTQSVEYTDDDQTTDFGSPQASVDVRIYQISASIGRGYPLEGAI